MASDDGVGDAPPTPLRSSICSDEARLDSIDPGKLELHEVCPTSAPALAAGTPSGAVDGSRVAGGWDA